MSTVLQSLQDAAAYAHERGVTLELCEPCGGIKITAYGTPNWLGPMNVQRIVSWQDIELAKFPVLIYKINEALGAANIPNA